MNKRLLTAAFIAAFVPLTACSAGSPSDARPASPSPDAVKKAFAARFPNRPVQSVSATPLPGIYEVVLPGRQIMYTDAKVNYLFLDANLIDVQKRESLTEARMEALSRVDWKSLPLADAVKEVRGNGARKLVVFSDPDCPFCKKLERETIARLDNVTVYTFLYPIAQLHPDAERKSRQIWCSADRAAAWTGLMRDGRPLSGRDDCATPLARLQKLGDSLGVNGTPALVFASGRLVAGAQPLEQVERWLAEKAAD
ncbi:thiol:disulfide interchange protein DsbC [Crenobacter luteus]|uniref:Thiol:disulfide interchange protein n=1 Tax=Crenobacter luteus TaxID=1452487 RepID=A0A165FQC0_9NEIS|nr:DsbC family protein [Crenobacter luteus]KZE33884.1 thiol:disulfide interchange protein [Crenobacter luteus]TCP15762.1 thiol:disulfide interchange protein DsbC [Crenobacter luteus]